MAGRSRGRGALWWRASAGASTAWRMPATMADPSATRRGDAGLIIEGTATAAEVRRLPAVQAAIGPPGAQESPLTGCPSLESGRGCSAVAVALLLLALAPTGGEATTRTTFSIAKSLHPETERDYSTVHPGLGATGRLVGQWLRRRTGLVRHSHRRVGPYAGVAATWQVSGSWRLGLSTNTGCARAMG